MEEKLRELAEDTAVSTDDLVYDQLPDCYVVGLPEGWPISCNLRCWSCTLTFQGVPHFIPTSMFETTVADDTGRTRPTVAFRRLGVTCTANCSATYIERNMRGEAAAQAKELLVHLYYAMHGKRVVWFEPASPHTDLKSYGGTKSDAQFWAELTKLDPDHGMPPYPVLVPRTTDDLNGVPDVWSLVDRDPTEEALRRGNFPALANGQDEATPVEQAAAHPPLAAENVAPNDPLPQTKKVHYGEVRSVDEMSEIERILADL